jgi:hypothetical protein
MNDDLMSHQGEAMLYALPALLIIGYGSVILWSHLRGRRIAAARKGVTLASFVGEFIGSDYSQHAIEAAYADLIELCGHPVLRVDKLEHTLGLVTEDLEGVLQRRCQRLGVADVWKSPYAKLFPLKTVDDYVRFLSEVMKDHPATV